jgi:hypothetical protein
MTTNDNGRRDRVRATRRLHNLTIGTALLGVAATGGFGALAAITYNGAAKTTATTATTAFTTTGSATTTATAAPTSPAVTTTTGTAHVTTGGS